MKRKPYRHLLLVVDGTSAGARKAKAAIALARALGARLTVAYAPPAADEGLTLGVGSLFGGRELIEHFEGAARERAGKALAPVRAAARKASVRCGIVPMKGRLAALARRRGCDLVVTAAGEADPRAGIARLVLP